MEVGSAIAVVKLETVKEQFVFLDIHGMVVACAVQSAQTKLIKLKLIK